MTQDEWRELMEESPGGENHGRRRGSGGHWRDMDRAYDEAKDLGLEYVVHVPIHGIRSTYKHDGCRCPSCRRANRDYMRKLRNKE